MEETDTKRKIQGLCCNYIDIGNATTTISNFVSNRVWILVLPHSIDIVLLHRKDCNQLLKSIKKD